MTSMYEKLRKMEEVSKQRKISQQRSNEQATPARKPKAKQAFFLPVAHDISTKDDLSIMDIAPFRLSKKHERRNAIIEYELKGARIQIKGGPDGMATVYDYDIVLMMISHLAEQTRLWREGKAQQPDRHFAPRIQDVLHFCQRGNNSQNYKGVEEALARLQNTTCRITVESGDWRRDGGFSLIDGYTVLSRTRTGQVSHVSIGVPNWMYEGVVSHDKPTVLTISPKYFLIDKGIARFLYRFARKTAGQSEAFYSLKELYKRSGSQGVFKKFCFTVRQIAADNSLPDYDLRLEGESKDILWMTRRRNLTTDVTAA